MEFYSNLDSGCKSGTWTRHVSRSQNRPYLYHHQRNERVWTEEGLPNGWAFIWEKQVKTYLNVLTNEKTTQRPASGTSGGDAAAPPVPAPAATKGGASSGPSSAPSSSKAVDPGTSDHGGAAAEMSDGKGRHEQQHGAAVSDQHGNVDQAEEEWVGEEGEEEPVEYDGKVGYPPSKPSVPVHPHGWCFKPQQSGLKQVLSENTYCVVELGSYLGNSTRAICEAAPNAQVYSWTSGI